MKIVHVITSLDKGGAENHIVDLAINQKKFYNHDISIIYWKGNNYWVPYLKKFGIRCYKLNTNLKKIEFNLFFNFLFCVFKLRKKINKLKPDILHAHLPFTEVLSRIVLYSKKDIKFVITKHLNSVFLCKNNSRKSFLGKILELYVARRADKVIVISNAVKKFMKLSVGINQSKLKTIYYGLDKLRSINLQNIKDKNFSKKKGELIIGSICRLVPQKRVDILIRGFSLYNNLYNNKSKLCIVGQGYLKRYLMNLSMNLKVSDKIIWLNSVSNIKKFFEKIDVFCLTSDHEGFGIVLLEAMLCGRPIIANKTSSIPEIIKNNYNGLLMNKNNDEELFKCLKKLNKLNKKKIIKNAKKIMKNKFTVRRMILETEKVYRSINS